MNIWGDEARTCEQDRKNQRNACNNKCLSDPYPQMCEDKCAAEYANDLAKERLEFHERKIKIYFKFKIIGGRLFCDSRNRKSYVIRHPLQNKALGWLVLYKIIHLYYVSRIVNMRGLSIWIEKVLKILDQSQNRMQ